MSFSSDIGFDDAGQPVLAQGFDYDALDAYDAGQPPSDDAKRPDPMDVMRWGGLICLEARTASAVRTRLAALLLLAGLFRSPSEAARTVGMHRSAMTHAARKLRSQIQQAALHGKPVQSVKSRAKRRRNATSRALV